MDKTAFMTVRDIVRVTRGRLVSGDPRIRIDPSRIATDTRTLKAGDLFLALSGNNFDGNTFLADAFQKKVCGVICTKRYIPQNAKDVVIVVRDTTAALQDIARAHRARFDIPVIAVTGSNGKTSVKDMIARVLSCRYKVLANEGTKNNHIGVPQTLLRLTRKHEACVIEFGTNHPGEIKVLGEIARPTIAVMTNIGPSHLEFFKDLAGVFNEKRTILSCFNEKRRGVAVINGDDPFLCVIKKGRFDIRRFGMKEDNDYCAVADRVLRGRTKFTVNGRYNFLLTLLGKHNIYNALAAIAVGRECGLEYAEIARALKRCPPSYMRLAVSDLNGITVINDAYNSNPLSMKCALEVLQCYPAHNRWLVAGDMLELGRGAIAHHRAVGACVADAGLSGLFTCGRLSRHMADEARRRSRGLLCVHHCKDHDEIARIFKKKVYKGDCVLLKGSRSMRMETVLEKLR